MNEQDAWKVFSQTGSIQDYLNYKAVKYSQAQEQESNENTNGRTDSKTTEYR